MQFHSSRLSKHTKSTFVDSVIDFCVYVSMCVIQFVSIIRRYKDRLTQIKDMTHIEKLHRLSPSFSVFFDAHKEQVCSCTVSVKSSSNRLKTVSNSSLTRVDNCYEFCFIVIVCVYALDNHVNLNLVSCLIYAHSP